MLRTTLPLRCLSLAALLLIAVGTACAEELPAERSVLIQPSSLGTTTEEPEATELKEQLVEPISTEQSEPASGAAELVEAMSDSHPWTSFDPGAWRRVVVISEVFDEEGAFAGRSSSERTERLTAIDETSYTLSIESVVELGGLRTPAPAELRRYSILTDRRASDDESITARQGEPSSISLGGKVASCRTWVLKLVTPAGTEVETLHLAMDTAMEIKPLVLRRERQSTLNDQPGTQLVESVTRLELPALYGQELSTTWHTTTSATHPSGARTEAFSVRGNDAPGGVFSETITEYDATGRKTRWAVTRLVASGRTAAESIGAKEEAGDSPAVSVEVRPRRFLRLLRREERRQEDPEAE